MTQTEARQMAEREGGIAINADQYHGRFASTEEWLVIKDGRIIGGRPNTGGMSMMA